MRQVRLIRQAGGQATFVRTDVRVDAEVRGLIDRTVSTYGRLDCAFNNTGTIILSPIVDDTETDFDVVVDTNVKGVFACLRHEIREMSKSGGGAIVNASSLAGLKGSRDRSLYAASKHAVVGLTRSVALEVAGFRNKGQCGLPGGHRGRNGRTLQELFPRQQRADGEQPRRSAGPANRKK